MSTVENYAKFEAYLVQSNGSKIQGNPFLTQYKIEGLGVGTIIREAKNYGITKIEYLDGIVTFENPNYIEIFKEKNRNEKATIDYNDEIDQKILEDFVLIHETDEANLPSILRNNALLCYRDSKACSSVSLPGKADSSIVFLQAVYKTDVCPSFYDRHVTLVLDPKLLLTRNDFYACSAWSYGPFRNLFGNDDRISPWARKYFGPDLRRMEEFDNIPIDETIPSKSTLFQNGPVGEVGFKNSVPLDGHLIRIVKQPDTTLGWLPYLVSKIWGSTVRFIAHEFSNFQL